MTASTTPGAAGMFPDPLPPEFQPLRECVKDWLARLTHGGRGYEHAHQALLAECERVRELGSDAQRQLIDDLARLAAPFTRLDALRQLPAPLREDLVTRTRCVADALHLRRATPDWVPRAIGLAIALPCLYALIQAVWNRWMPGAGSLAYYLERHGRQVAHRVENASTFELTAGLALGMMAVGWYTMRAARSV
jgi:hypothetical protein